VAEQSRKAELERLAKQAEEIINFVASQNHVVRDRLLSAVRRGLAFGRVLPMKVLVEEMIHMAKIELRAEDHKQLLVHLEQLGFPVVGEQKAADRKISGILARGRIRTRREYDVARARVEEMEVEGHQGEDLEKLQSMVQAFELTGKDTP
jgi:hypothetical protein